MCIRDSSTVTPFMHFQVWRPNKPLIAHGTGIWVLSIVNPFVLIQVWRLYKPLIAHPFVLFQVWRLYKRFTTHSISILALSAINPFGISHHGMCSPICLWIASFFLFQTVPMWHQAGSVDDLHKIGVSWAAIQRQRGLCKADVNKNYEPKVYYMTGPSQLSQVTCTSEFSIKTMKNI